MANSHPNSVQQASRLLGLVFLLAVSLLLLFLTTDRFDVWVEAAAWAASFVALLIGLYVARRFEELVDRTHLYSILLDTLPDSVVFKDHTGVFRYANATARQTLNVDPVGLTEMELFGERVAERHVALEKQVMEKGATSDDEWLRLKSGKRVLMRTRLTPVCSNADGMLGIAIVSHDMTEQQRFQNNLEYTAQHDALTGLANRALLVRSVEYALRLARRNRSSMALLLLDIDHFRLVNDSLGHDIGDLLLQDIAQRLLDNTRDSDLCARLGGDEFVVLLTDCGDEGEIRSKVENLMAAISQPYALKGHDLAVTASLGVARFPEDGDQVDELVRSADAAMLHCRHQGHGQYSFYSDAMSESAFQRLGLEQDLRQALAQQSLSVLYQPQFRVGDSHPCRVEALVRWHHPTLGSVSPGEFIPLAETLGLIVPLGEWVLRQACRDFLHWRSQGLELEKVAVNVSAMQINAAFAESVIDIIEDEGFDPTWLELEVTESTMMSGITEVVQQLQILRRYGIEFAMDDFGTGYSSLSKIKSLPLSSLKLDQSFVRNINTDNNDYEIARAVILMASSLGFTVVAEGVEEAIQAYTLENLGCDLLQGHHFSPALTSEQILRTYSLSDDETSAGFVLDYQH